MQTMAAGLQLFRPVNFLITFLTISVAAFISGGAAISSIIVLFASISGGLTASAGNIINDIYDIEIDKVNKPYRPLPSGRISKKNAILIYVVIVITALVIAALINSLAFIVVVLANLLLWLYSLKLKSLVLIGNTIVAFLTGFTFFYGGIAAGNVEGAIIPAGFAFIINLIRELIKDMEDVEGDLLAGRETFPGLFGFEKTKILILILSILLIILTLLPFYLRIYTIEYFIIVMLTVNISFIYFLKNLFASNSNEVLKRLSSILKMSMVLGLIAIFFGNESI
jgi:geranylgeranylglycerol-phosphate geranylgeranyltransferase